ncbi:hypothetical protein WJX81_007713 [Elliptochloris bilobata]|uniref:CAAX prenyl protease 2/Lysostaphin resistance protein A-like domain-containing protein n=1 Tax=Elliptochloris bilobata TaxID=381761 RepID=A0AAW1S0G8_9CHLO
MALHRLACICLPFGLNSGFLIWEPVSPPALVLPVVVTTALAPALTEEAVFRAMLLAHPSVDGVLPGPARLAVAAALPLAVFVAYHLANPQEQARQTFWNWRFLVMAGVLGAACTGAYHATGGSLVAAAVTHWVPVNAWLLLLGGYRKTRGGRQRKHAP